MSKSNLTPLRRRRRNAARAALYASFLVTGAGVLALWSYIERSGPAVEVYDWRADYASEPAVQLLQRYIAVDTSETSGVPVAGLEFVAEHLRSAGIEPTLERVGEEDGVLWAVLEGDDPRAVVLHHHVDVDPILHPERWVQPPFGGVIDGPWLYGRGAFDMKSVGVAQIEAFLRLAEAAAVGRRPRRTVILLATTGEETGSELGTRWLLAKHPELVERFDVVLTEGGAVEGREQGDVKYWGTEFAQRRSLRITFCSDSRERLEDLEEDLRDGPWGWTGPELPPELTGYLAHYAPTRDREDWRELFGDPHRLARDPVTLEGLPPYVQSLFRNQVATLPPEETSGGWEMRASLQLIPGADAEAVLAERFPPWKVHGVAMTVYDEGAADHGSPLDHPVLGEIEAVLAARYPEATIGPIYLPWTLTDSRFLRAHGVDAYGFSPFMVLTPEAISLMRWGTVNERIGLPGFLEGIEIYAELLERIAGAEPADGAR